MLRMIVPAAGLLFMIAVLAVEAQEPLQHTKDSLDVVKDNLKAGKAIRRSIELAKDSWGRIFLLMLLVGVIKLGLVALTQFFVFIAAFKHPGQPMVVTVPGAGGKELAPGTLNAILKKAGLK